MRRRLAALALVVMTACVPIAASCGGDDEPSEASETTTTSSTAPPESTAPPTTLTAEQQVEAAFHEVHAVIGELTTTRPNPDDARLPELLIDPQLTAFRENLTQLMTTNQVYEPGQESSYEITDTVIDPTGTTATVIVCAVGADKLVDRDTGDVVREGIATSKNQVSFRQQNGRWMMEQVANLDSWEGVTQCDA